MLTRILLPSFLVIVMWGCAPRDQTASEIELAVEQVSLFPDDPGRARLGNLRYTGGLVLSSDHDQFGGISAMEFNEDGTELLAITDRGQWLNLDLDFDGERLAGASNLRFAPILDTDGRPVTGQDEVDSEGLARLGEDQYAISFERNHRIWTYTLEPSDESFGASAAQLFTPPPGSERLRNNGGMEALAANNAVLYVGIEYPIVDGQPHTLWRFDLTAPGTEPRALNLALGAGFGLTGLALDDAGGLYVVERFYNREIGNRIRVGYIPSDVLDQTSPEPIAPEIQAIFEPEMTVDNFEAIALTHLDGQTRLFLASDDNFNTRQRTLLLSFVLEPQ